jgi:hypothetical protein
VAVEVNCELSKGNATVACSTRQPDASMYREKCLMIQTCACGTEEFGKKTVFDGSISITGTRPERLTLSSAM